MSDPGRTSAAMADVREPNLGKFLSLCGVSSRRGAVELIRAGRVSVNGVVELDPARRVSPEAVVRLDGDVLSVPKRFHYVMLNKPRGYVCSNFDRHAEKLAVDLLRGSYPGFLRSAGRLDKESEGLIVLSDDGAYLERVAHPRHMVNKRYVVTVAHELAEADLERMVSGIADDGEVLRVVSVESLGGRRYMFKLNEGKKREIRRLCRACGAPVLSLKRVALGALELGNLKSGEHRELAPEEVEKSLIPG